MENKKDVAEKIKGLEYELIEIDSTLEFLEEEIKINNCLRPFGLYIPKKFEVDTTLELINEKNELENQREKIMPELILLYAKDILYQE